MTREKVDLLLRILVLFKAFFSNNSPIKSIIIILQCHHVSAVTHNKIKTFDFRISKKSASFVFKYDLTN